MKKPKQKGNASSTEVSPLPPSKQATCRHQLLQVRSHNALAVTVACVRCDLTFDIPYENVERYFLTFQHNSTRGPSEDITLLINERIFK